MIASTERRLERELAQLGGYVPFFNRIQFLCANASLAFRPLGTYANTLIYPNCFGTTLFIVQGERSLLSHRDIEARDGYMVAAANTDDFAIFPKDFDRPGSTQSLTMRMFLQRACFPTGLQQGVIVTTTGRAPEDEKRQFPLHPAIYIGNYHGKDYVFEQIGNCRPFHFTTLQAVRSRWNNESTDFFQYRGMR